VDSPEDKEAGMDLPEDKEVGTSTSRTRSLAWTSPRTRRLQEDSGGCEGEPPSQMEKAEGMVAGRIGHGGHALPGQAGKNGYGLCCL
jgi:hypothetical protein